MKKPSLQKTLLLSAITTVSLSTHAQAQTTDPLVVTVSTPLRMAQPIDQTLAATTIINRTEIDRQQPESVAQLLRGTPGVELTSNGGAGGVTSLFLRGSNSNHTLVLIDGIKANNPTDGAFRWEFIPVSQIERIEIVRGPQSSIWGANALGGVVNIITQKDSARGVQGELKVGAGQNNTQLTHANMSSANESTRFSSSLSYRKTDGFNAQKADSSAEKDGFEHYALRLHAEHDFNDQNTLSVGYLKSQGTNEYDGFMGVPNLKQDFSLENISLDWTHLMNDNWSLNSKIARTTEIREDTKNGTDDGRLDSYRDFFNLSTKYEDRSLALSLGIEGNREKLRSAKTVFGDTDSRNSHGAFSQAYFQVTDLLAFQAGLRIDNDEFFGDQVTGNIGVSYAANDANTLGATYATGFRAPSLNELYGFGGNPELDAEQSNNVELFWKYHPSQSFQTEIRVFDNTINDLINFDENDVNYNIDEAKIQGAELSTRYSINNWHLAASLTLQNPKNVKEDSLLSRRARESGKIDIDYQLAHWGAGLSIQGQSKRDNSTFDDIELAGYVLANTRAYWHLSPDLTLRAKIDNLFDKDYEQAAGYNTQDRYVETSLTYRF